MPRFTQALILILIFEWADKPISGDKEYLELGLNALREFYYQLQYFLKIQGHS